MTSRLKSLLPIIISDIQCAFTPDCLITDDIFIAYENFHSMHGNVPGRGGEAIYGYYIGHVKGL